MPESNHPENKLLAVLPRRARHTLLEKCERVHLGSAEVLCEPGAPVRHVHFPTGGIISLVIPDVEHTGVEVGLVGNEGVLGLSVLLGVDISPVRAVVQGAGSAWRIPSATLLGELDHHPSLKRRLLRYLYVSMRGLAQSAACTRFHIVEERLARWLLMTQDRAESDAFHVTQEFLAYMLGVRRAGVTEAAGVLQRRKLIAYRRGNITVLDREGLITAACACYRIEQTVFGQFLK